MRQVKKTRGLKSAASSKIFLNKLDSDGLRSYSFFRGSLFRERIRKSGEIPPRSRRCNRGRNLLDRHCPPEAGGKAQEVD